MQAREHPLVDFRSPGERYERGRSVKPINIGIQRKKIVRIVEGGKKAPCYLGNSLSIEFKVVPGVGIADHVPT